MQKKNNTRLNAAGIINVIVNTVIITKQNNKMDL